MAVAESQIVNLLTQGRGILYAQAGLGTGMGRVGWGILASELA